MEKTAAIGIDLGGTNLKGIVMTADGEGRHLTRIPTEAAKGGARVLENILTLIDLLIQKEGGSDSLMGVGIGSPGFVDGDGVVLGGAANLPGWQGTQIFAPINERFALPATAANDVTVTALAEYRFGAGRGVDNMVCLALGTGIGGGIVINGSLYKGRHGMAGELGHVIVETDGLQCNCGQRGCVEQYASATGIANMARRFVDQAQESTPFVERVRRDPAATSAKMVYDAVKDGDPVALKVHATSMHMLARVCGIICNTLSPDRIVLGGGVLMAGQIIVDEVRKNLPAFCWEDICKRCEIARAECGEDAGVLGAAAMVFDELAEK